MAGDFQPGAQLPSTSTLVERYGVANPTIQKALRALKAEGFLTSQQGKGVYVRDKQPFTVEVAPYFAPAPGGYSYDLIEVAAPVPPAEVRQVFGLDEGARALLRRRILRHNGQPVELGHSYYPLAIVAGSDLMASRKIRGGARRVLADLGYPQARFVDRVSTREPTTEEVEMLDLPLVPVIRQFRVIYTAADVPVEASVLIKGGHLYELVYRQLA